MLYYFIVVSLYETGVATTPFEKYYEPSKVRFIINTERKLYYMKFNIKWMLKERHKWKMANVI